MTIWSGRDEDALPAALCSDLQVTTFDQVVGPGRLLHQAYAVAGHGVEKALGRTAHKLGLGPTAATRRIEKVFGDDALTRQSRLDRIYDSFRQGSAQNEPPLCALKKDCQNLLKYALP